MKRIPVTARLSAILLACIAGPADKSPRAWWPHFRGPHSSGVGESDPPVQFGPNKKFLWKTPAGPGQSSPVQAGEIEKATPPRLSKTDGNSVYPRVVHWYARVIINFRDEWLRAFFVENVRSRGFPFGLDNALFRKLQMIDDATADVDLRVPPGNHFEKLRGRLEGRHSIRINKHWRLIFRWDGSRGEARDVCLDAHRHL